MTDEEYQRNVEKELDDETMLSGRGLFWCRFIGATALILWVLIWGLTKWLQS